MTLARAGVLIACLCTAGAAAPARVWETVEIGLRAADTHPDPVGGVEVWVDLEGPGFSKRVYGFWDGENDFRVRVTATAPGTWRWRSGSLPEDRGLAAKSGAFQAAPWTEAEKKANPNRRGPIRAAAGGRHFEYADGTPFFLLADTLWAGNTARCGLGPGRDGPFFEYLSGRLAKGFTAVLMQAIHGYGDYPEAQAHRNEGGYALLDRDPSRLNPAYFQALDTRVRALWERGLVLASPVMWWGKTNKCLFKPQDAERIAGYIAARYGTFNLLWSVSGEYQYTFKDCGWTPADLSRLGAAIGQRNSWRHPVSIHPSGRVHWPAPHNVQSSRPFHGEPWIDHHWLQTGQELKLVPNIVARLAENRALEPAMPVFCSESSYERAADPDSAYHARWQAWTAFLNGAAGYGYGAHGVWQFLDPADPEGEPGKMTAHPPVPWRKAIRLPGSEQVGHVRMLLSLGWPDLEPRRDALRLDGGPNPLPAADDLTPPHAARIGKGTWVVYVPRGNAGREIAFADPPPGKHTAQWFDPRTGRFTAPPALWRAEQRGLPSLPDPESEDWVLVVRR